MRLVVRADNYGFMTGGMGIGHRRLHYGGPQAAIGLLVTSEDLSQAVFCMESISTLTKHVLALFA
jgi:hypothetical protein